MKKRSQALRTLDRLRRYGYVTNRIIFERLGCNNPYERIRTIRETMRVPDVVVKSKSGERFKVYYINRDKALNYIKRNGLRVA